MKQVLYSVNDEKYIIFEHGIWCRFLEFEDKGLIIWRLDVEIGERFELKFEVTEILG
jgi:hypothetical protein